MTAGVSGRAREGFKYVDLFAGCGGLSLGLKRAGGDHVLAVEKSPMASESYYRNLIDGDGDAWNAHVRSGVTEQSLNGLVVGPLESVLGDVETMDRLAEMDIDLVAGGPPCQGFSLAGRRRSDDPRNILAWEFLDFVKITKPKFVIIENVLGMHRKFHSSSAQTPFESLREALRQLNYRVQGVLLNAKHYGAPQSRPRMMLIGVREAIAAELELEPTNSVLESAFRNAVTHHERSLLPPSRIIEAEVRKVADALADLDKRISKADKSHARQDYLEEMTTPERWRLESRPGVVLPNHAMRNHREPTEQLFRLLKILKDHQLLAAARQARRADFAKDETLPLLDLLENVPFPLRSPDGKLEAATSDELLQHIREHLTRKHSQTVLDWVKPSRTVVTIPDDYVHPLVPRTFSVRELARLQGFPDAFEFHGKVTTGGKSRRVDVPQYTQVGNAVSPFVGLALGEMIAGYMEELATK